MFVITGATGNIGGRIAERLLSEGRQVRVVGRNREKLQYLIDKGAEPFEADLLDADAMTKAFTGAQAVYILIPPSWDVPDHRGYQNVVGESLATAVKNAGVKYVVNLSSVGAHLPEKVGVIKGLYDQEQRLNKLEGTNVLHLRPTYFMENHLWAIETIKNYGMFGSPLKPDIPMAQIATTDIADIAAGHLLERDFSGKIVRELLGPKEVTMSESAAILGKAVGKDHLQFTQTSYEDTHQQMVDMGISEDVANEMIELYRSLNEGICKPTEARSAENTTPTTMESFARGFAAAYNA
jgi:uncharacterized protein YbjT (DUF2867 family)